MPIFSRKILASCSTVLGSIASASQTSVSVIKFPKPILRHFTQFNIGKLSWNSTDLCSRTEICKATLNPRKTAITEHLTKFRFSTSWCQFSSSTKQPNQTDDLTSENKPTNVPKHPPKILTQKRPARIKTVEKDESDKIVAAYSVAEEINLERLQKAFERKGLYRLIPLPSDAEALLFKAIYPIDSNDREVFFFRKGSAVFWNFSETEKDDVLQTIQLSCENLEPVIEKEYLEYRLTDTPTRLVGERIDLNDQHEGDTLLLEKYACSDALSQSVLLTTIEDALQDLSGSMEEIAQNLKEGNKIQLSKKQVLQKTGEIFVFRCKINLSADYLITPDFYWERDHIESIYQSIYSHLLIGKRTRILNERIELCSDLTHLIHSKLTDQHHIKLEYYIVALICIEVMFEIIHFIVRYFS